MVEQLTEAAVLMGVGMTVVFLFLSLLIAGVHLIAWYCRVFPSLASDSTSLNKTAIKDKPASTQASVSPSIIAAISAAIHQHTQQKK